MEMMRSVHLDDDFGEGGLEGLYAINDLLESKFHGRKRTVAHLIQPRKGVCRELILRACGEITY
jgi:hypothetical protein